MDPLKVLVIDDEDHILKMIKNRLEANGFLVLTAKTGHEGIELARQHRPHLIVLDVILPDLNGRVVCRVLKEDESTAKIPVIFLTAKDSLEEKMAEYEVGGECHIPKPFDGQELVEKIRRTIESISTFETKRSNPDEP
ncbi:MAG: response regulator [Candidatus Aureabacteria bacterium]|nr:response regulator [Candidatus Auribacterota bacterium]